MKENVTRYYKFDVGGGAMRRNGLVIEYLDKEGNWIVDRELIRKFIGGDTNFDEISYEEVQKIIEQLKK